MKKLLLPILAATMVLAMSISTYAGTLTISSLDKYAAQSVNGTNTYTSDFEYYDSDSKVEYLGTVTITVNDRAFWDEVGWNTSWDIYVCTSDKIFINLKEGSASTFGQGWQDGFDYKNISNYYYNVGSLSIHMEANDLMVDRNVYSKSFKLADLFAYKYNGSEDYHIAFIESDSNHFYYLQEPKTASDTESYSSETSEDETYEETVNSVNDGLVDGQFQGTFTFKSYNWKKSMCEDVMEGEKIDTKLINGVDYQYNGAYRKMHIWRLVDFQGNPAEYLFEFNKNDELIGGIYYINKQEATYEDFENIRSILDGLYGDHISTEELNEDTNEMEETCIWTDIEGNTVELMYHAENDGGYTVNVHYKYVNYDDEVITAESLQAAIEASSSGENEAGEAAEEDNAVNDANGDLNYKHYEGNEFIYVVIDGRKYWQVGFCCSEYQCAEDGEYYGDMYTFNTDGMTPDIYVDGSGLVHKGIQNVSFQEGYGPREIIDINETDANQDSEQAGSSEDETCFYGNYEYSILEDGTVQIDKYDYSGETYLVIADQIDGKKVTSIGEYAFTGIGIETLVIPDSVTSIGDCAFRLCVDLKRVTIPDSVTEMGLNPFIGCNSLESIYVSPDNTAFDVIEGVLYNKKEKSLVCYSVTLQGTSFEIPQGILTIGSNAFADSNLESIIIPDSVTVIGDDAFTSCCSLINIIIPDSVLCIGYNAFSYCSSLESVSIPSSVTYIGEGIFYGCNNPKIVSSEGSYAIQYAADNGINYEYENQHDWLNN